MKSLRVLLLLALALPLILPAAESPSPVGYWQFPGKAIMKLGKDGSAARVRSRGHWAWDDEAQRQFTVLWGNKTSLHFTLAADDSKITFANKKGRLITVVRVTEAEAKKAAAAGTPKAADKSDE